jgi:RecJ-like exonuclease
MSRKPLTFTYETPEGEEIEVEVPTYKQVCSRCDGEGKHTNPSIDGNGITSSEWAEWDDEDRETYMSGGYDVVCEECHGANVVDVPQFDVMWDKDAKLSDAYKSAYREQVDADAAYERMCESERRYCGDW